MSSSFHVSCAHFHHRVAPKIQCRHSPLLFASSRAGEDDRRALRRRDATFGILLSVISPSLITPPEAGALGFKKDLTPRRRGISDPTLYSPLENGLKIYDLEEGRGEEVKDGTRLEVHYDCRYRGLDVVSSRAARLLGGNRIIAVPLDFVAGQPVVVNAAVVDARGGGGLFIGGSGPKPPPALSSAVIGMKRGGRRSVIVPPELGYGSKGVDEIPPDATFELLIEVLKIFR